MKHLVASDLKEAFGHKSGIPKWFKRKRTSLAVIDDIFYQKVKEGNKFIARLVIPNTMITEVLDGSHGDCRSCHPRDKKAQGEARKILHMAWYEKRCYGKVGHLL